MKICEKCGAYNSDERMFCVDCNEKLDGKISSAHQRELDEKTKALTERLYDRNAPLYVSLYDKIVGIGCAVGSALLLVGTIMLMLKNRGTSEPLLFLLFGVLGTVEAFIPKINWELEKLRLSLRVNNVDDLSPSSFYKFSRKFSETACLIICIVGAVLTVGAVIHPPVMEYADSMSYTVIDFKNPTVEELIEYRADEWNEIISGGNYTVSRYLKHLRGYNRNWIGTREQLMIQAIIEIEALDACYSDYYNVNQFLEDYESQQKNKK